jgi:hypothetical protein
MSPSGRLFVTVPNRDRMTRLPREPLDCPPHHITRWTSDQLRYLADSVGLRVDELSFEPPSRWIVRQPQRRRSEAWSRWLGRRASHVIRRVDDKVQPPTWWYARQVRRGTYVRRGMFGHTMLAQLSLPAR